MKWPGWRSRTTCLEGGHRHPFGPWHQVAGVRVIRGVRVDTVVQERICINGQCRFTQVADL